MHFVWIMKFFSAKSIAVIISQSGNVGTRSMEGMQQRIDEIPYFKSYYVCKDPTNEVGWMKSSVSGERIECDFPQYIWVLSGIFRTKIFPWQFYPIVSLVQQASLIMMILFEFIINTIINIFLFGFTLFFFEVINTGCLHSWG